MSGSVVLKPYEQRRPLGPVARTFSVLSLVFIAAIYGIMSVIFPLQIIYVPLTPILLLFGLSLWLLPDIGGMPIARLQSLTLWFVALNVLWPSYVAVNAPGLPWINPARILMFTIFAVFIFNYSSSQAFRDIIKERTDASKYIKYLFWGFWLLTTLSLAFSTDQSQSLPKYVNNQLYWTMIFLVSAVLASNTGFVSKLSRIFVATTMVLVLLGILEYKLQRVFWLDHLPFFLRVDEGLLEKVGDVQARAGTDVYRVRGTFIVSLYFAEYLALVFPFIIHELVHSRKFYQTVVLFFGALGTMVLM